MKISLVLALAFVLAGCISTPEPVHVQRYSLTTARATTSQQSQKTSHAPILRMTKVRVPSWLDSTQMHYRLAYANAAQIGAYSRSAWVASPATLLARSVQAALTGSDQWRAVLLPGTLGAATLSLHLELNDFEQRFTNANTSVGVVDVTATLLDAQHDTVRAQTHFHIEKPAPSADAGGGVKALSAAVQALNLQLVQWLASVAH